MPLDLKPELDKAVLAEDLRKPQSFVYLPKEGLQGEEIPSHILWDNMEVKSVRIAFSPPLKSKDVFNAESLEKQENCIVINKVELEGYIGLLFESSKVSDLEVTIPVEYVISLFNGKTIKETKKIKLFRPQLEVKVSPKGITIDANTGFVRNRIKAKNIGRGVLLMRIDATEDSQVKLETPPEHREFSERFNADLKDEMAKLSEAFPNFKPLWEEMLFWDTKEVTEFSTEEQSKFTESLDRLTRLLASNKKLLLGFIEAYEKAFAKNTELVETVRKIIDLYESLVSKDILLFNPLDEAILSGKEGTIILNISQTDRVWDKYDDIKLPEIKLTSSQGIKIPLYRLFEWG